MVVPIAVGPFLRLDAGLIEGFRYGVWSGSGEWPTRLGEWGTPAVVPCGDVVGGGRAEVS